MANRWFRRNVLCQEVDVVKLYGSITFGSGAVSSYKGPWTVTRSTTGDYYLTLQDNFNKFLSLKVTDVGSTSSAIVEWRAYPSSTTVDANVQAKKLYFKAYTATATVADAANGSIVTLEVTLRNSNVSTTGF